MVPLVHVSIHVVIIILRERVLIRRGGGGPAPCLVPLFRRIFHCRGGYPVALTHQACEPKNINFVWKKNLSRQQDSNCGPLERQASVPTTLLCCSPIWTIFNSQNNLSVLISIPFHSVGYMHYSMFRGILLYSILPYSWHNFGCC